MVFLPTSGPAWMQLLLLCVFGVVAATVLPSVARYFGRFKNQLGGGPTQRNREDRRFHIPPMMGRSCINPLCRHINRHAARFCSQCGQRLE